MDCSKIWCTCLYKINNVSNLVFLAGRKNSPFTSKILLERRGGGVNGFHNKRRLLHFDFPKYYAPCVIFNVFKETIFIRYAFLLSAPHL
jgi:hypothetical protein